VSETLEAHLRRETRNFTSPLGEERVFELATRLARALLAAHEAVPPSYPGCDPARTEMTEAGPRPNGDSPSAREDLVQLGALVCSLLLGRPPHLSWRLDGPPAYAARGLLRRSALRACIEAASAREVLSALEASGRPAVAGSPLWPTFRGDERRSGARADAPTPTRTRPLWRAATGPLVGSPVCTDSWVAAVTTAGVLHLFDAADGRSLEERSLGAGSESSPALSGSLLIIGTEDGEVVGFDLEAGAARWRSAVGRLVRSSPLVSASRVYVGVIDDPGGALVALDAATGETLWRTPLGPAFASPTLLASSVVIGSDDGAVRAFDPDGATLWSTDLRAKVRSTAACLGDRLLVADYAGRVSALGTTDGALIWSQVVGSPIYASPCAARDRCLVGTHAGTVHALSLESGRELFRLTTGGPVVGSAVAVGEAWLVPSTDGTLYGLDDAGARCFTHPTGAAIQASPAAGPERLYVANDAGLTALELAT
jgi:outer membrane protein assembly factor BamB